MLAETERKKPLYKRNEVTSVCPHSRSSYF